MRLFLLLAVLATPWPVSAGHCENVLSFAGRIMALRDSDPAGGVARAQTAITELAKSDHRCVEGEAMLQAALGSNLIILGRTDDAIDAYLYAIGFLGDEGTPVQRATLNRGLGVAYAAADKFEEAIKHYLVALSESEAAGDTVESGKTASNIGLVYNTLGQLDESQQYLDRALASFREVGWKEGIAGTLINLGALAAKREQYVPLRDYNEQALTLFTELGNPRGVAYAASNVGLAHDRIGAPELALPFHRRALQARRDIGDRDGTVNSLVYMAATLTALKRYAEAERALVEADALVPPDILFLKASVIEPWVVLEEARGDYRAALARQRQLAQVRDALAAADNQARIVEVQARYDSERQAQQIQRLEHQQAVGDLELKRRRLQLQAAIAITLLVVALLGAMFARYLTKVRAQAALERAARTDELTGLGNRREIRARIEYEIQRSRRNSRPFTIALIDLDDFKDINDRHGHGVGDRVLVGMVQRITEMLRRQDTLARWGGDELLVLLPETDEAGARSLARKLVDRLGGEPLVVDGMSHKVTLTIGVAQYWPGMTADDCIRRADESMYAGKSAGKNRVAEATTL